MPKEKGRGYVETRAKSNCLDILLGHVLVLVRLDVLGFDLGLDLDIGLGILVSVLLDDFV